jgi:hypothetical protein
MAAAHVAPTFRSAANESTPSTAAGLTASAKATASLADQPPLTLRRSAGALAKAEGLRHACD